MAGIPYTGAGNSTTKKEAEKNAARDYINFLVRTGQLNASDVPATAIEQGGALPARSAPAEPNARMFQVCGRLSNGPVFCTVSSVCFMCVVSARGIFSRAKGHKISARRTVR